MSLLWISGRTALLLTLFSLLAAHAVVSKRFWLGAVWTMLAMLSKEEAVLLPFMLTSWAGLAAWIDEGLPGRDAVKEAFARTWTLVVPLLAYTAVRIQTDAWTPSTAIEAYRFTFDLARVTRNARWFFAVGACDSLSATALLVLTQGTRSTEGA